MISIDLFAAVLSVLIVVTLLLIGSLFAYKELWEEKETLLSKVRYYESLKDGEE